MDLNYIGRTTPFSRTDTGFMYLSFENRSKLRTANPGNGDFALVDTLGLFRYVAGSTMTDDDQSCFATTNGRWIIDLVTWEYIQAIDMAWRDNVDHSLIKMVPYTNRDSLRTGGYHNQPALVDQLGLFRFDVNSIIEIDDDETCFRAPAGAWLLQAVHWQQAAKMIDRYWSNYPAVRAKIPMTSAGLGSISSHSITSFTLTAANAQVNDHVLVTSNSNIVSAWGYISATNVLTIMVRNPIASTIDASGLKVSAIVFVQ